MRITAKILLLLLFLLPIISNADTPRLTIIRTRDKAKQALQFCKQKGYNTKYCILIDMSLSSGVKRFVIWDFAKNDTLLTGLVSHGCSRWPWSGTWSMDKPEFSNADGSHCTALGRYRINEQAYSAWGIHIKYFLTGLDKTNNNAMARQIVFHSWERVAEREVYPNGTPEGWGCPAVSNNTLKKVSALIKQQQKHMLMWIYN